MRESSSVAVSGNERWTLAVLFLTALTLRALFAVNLPDRFPTWRDSQHYLAIAHSVVEEGAYSDTVGQWPSEPAYSDVGPTSFWLPGYPLLLAGSIAIFGESARAVFLLQALLGALTILPTFGIGRLLAGARLGAVGAALMAFNPMHIWITGRIGAEILATLLFGLALYLALACSESLRAHGRLATGSWVSLQVVLGLGVLTRSNFVFIAAAIIGYLVLRLALIPRSRRELVRALLTVAASGLILVGPWVARNYQLWGECIYTTKAGINMALGFNDGANGTWDLALFEFVEWPSPSAYDELQRDGLLRQQALDWIRANPLRSTWLVIRKLIVFWNPMPGYSTGFARWAGLSWSSVLLGLALLGTVLAARDRRPLALPLLSIAAYTIPITLAFAVTRYRLSLDPILVVLAGYACCYLAARIKHRG